MASEHFSMTAAPTCEVRALKVLSGTHRDASVVLGRNDLLVIGADESCDVCLSDAGLAARHAALAMHADAVSIRRLDGAVSVNGRELSAGSSVLLDSDSEIALGDSQVTLRFAGPSHATEHSSPSTSDSEMEPIHAQPVDAHESVPRKASIWVKAPIVAVAVIVIAGIVAQQLQSSHADAAPWHTSAAPARCLSKQHIANRVDSVLIRGFPLPGSICGCQQGSHRTTRNNTVATSCRRRPGALTGTMSRRNVRPPGLLTSLRVSDVMCRDQSRGPLLISWFFCEKPVAVRD